MLWLYWRSGILPRSNHDYAAYVGQWQLLLTGADPWSTDNSYGPLHTAIGFLLPWGPLAPKFFMVGALLVKRGKIIGQGKWENELNQKTSITAKALTVVATIYLPASFSVV